MGTPFVNRQTDMTENITLPQTTYAGGKYLILTLYSALVTTKTNLSTDKARFGIHQNTFHFLKVKSAVILQYFRFRDKSHFVDTYNNEPEYLKYDATGQTTDYRVITGSLKSI